jgi:WD40 repeat protein
MPDAASAAAGGGGDEPPTHRVLLEEKTVDMRPERPEQTAASSADTQVFDSPVEAISSEAGTVGFESHRPQAGPSISEPRPDRIGRFRVLDILGSGAFGTVYRAFDPVLDREVALKVPRFAEDDPEVIERFLREAKAAARLRHPNIVAIFESGQAAGTSYIASELVIGVPLSRLLREQPIEMRTAVDWVRQIAEALDYAHAEGIVHRDIKPANIMINRAGRPQVMDFGLAKRAADEAARMSIEGQIIGTPAYMAPEQARGRLNDVGPHSDQYSVGVVLYQLLCGRTPFVGDPWSVMSRVSDVHEAPPPPRALRPDLPRDLEACCLKALEKEPAARYPGLQAFSDDLTRWLEGRPLKARPLGAAERLMRWCRKNRALAALGGMLTTLIVAAAIVGPLLAVRFRDLADTALRKADDARIAREQEKAARLATERLLIDTYTEAGLAADRNGAAREAILWFSSAAARSVHDPLRDRHNRMRFQSWLSEVAIPVHAFETADGWIRALRYHPSGRYLMAEADPSLCAIHDLRERRLMPLSGPVDSAAWSPDGQMLVRASGRTVVLATFPAGKEIDRWLHADKVICSAFSADGKWLAIGGERTAQVRELCAKAFATPPLPQGARVLSVTLSKDGSRLATRCADQLVRVYGVGGPDRESAPREEVSKKDGTLLFPPQPAKAEGVEVTPLFVDDNRLIIVNSGTSISCWDTDRRQRLWERKSSRMHALAASRDNRFLAIGEVFDAVVLDAAIGKPVGRRITHRNFVHDVAFHPDGGLLLTASGDQTARVSEIRSGAPLVSVIPHNGPVSRCVWSPDGSTFATVHWSDPLVRVWKLGRGQPNDYTVPLTARHAFVKVSADGKRLLPCGIDNLREGRDLQVYDAATGAPIGKRLALPGLVSDATFVPGTALIAAGGSARADRADSALSRQRLDEPGAVRFLGQETGTPAFPDIPTPSEPVALEASPDGRTVVVLCHRGECLLIDSRTGKVRARCQAFQREAATHGYVIRGRIRFSPAGDRFAIWGCGPTIEVHTVATGGLLFAVQHEKDFVHDVQFAPDGSRLATCSSDMTVRLWNANDGTSAGPTLHHSGWVFSAQFSRDGKRLLTASSDRQARIWDLDLGRVIVTTLAQTDEVFAVTYLPGDELFLIGTRDGQISAWEGTLGKMVAPPRRVPDMVYQLALTKGGTHVVAAGRLSPMRAFAIADWIRQPDPHLSGDDIRLLGEILSSQQIHEGRAATGLSTDQWLQRWQEFRSKHPNYEVLSMPARLVAK